MGLSRARASAPVYRRWAILVLPLILLFTYHTCSCGLNSPFRGPGGSAGSSASLKPPPPSTTPVATLSLSELPKHVRRVVDHLRSIRDFRPLKGFRGGRLFRNREGRLPAGRSYREFDVRPLQPELSRGAERLVVDESKRFFYYTSDHYRTFTQILLP